MQAFPGAPRQQLISLQSFCCPHPATQPGRPAAHPLTRAQAAAVEKGGGSTAAAVAAATPSALAAAPEAPAASRAAGAAAATPVPTPSQARDGSAEAAAQGFKATLLVECPDSKGVIAALAQLLYGLGCNIVESDQFTDMETSTYFQRIRFDYSELVIGRANTAVLERAVGELAGRFAMRTATFWDRRVKRVAVLVSKLDHCLWDLLIRHQAGELNCEIPLIISNHSALEGIARAFGVPFHHLPIRTHNGADAAAAKQAQEAEIEAALEKADVDLVVLARYMQVLSPEFCARHRNIINIHHSFLPAFEGAKPYHRAKERGVKIIGATAHFVTSELDAGPIIEQEVTRISHKDTVETMVRKGRDLERMVLARALRWVLDDRVLVQGNRTIVFE